MRALGSIMFGFWVAGAFTGAVGSPRAGIEPGPTTRVPVLLELFTSEGCSSCPPADTLLAEIVHHQTIANAIVIGIGEHVDYWDRLGWRDPFSAAAFTARQTDYEQRVFHTGSIYTPQIVVDGRIQVVGSDRTAVERAIRDAGRLPKAEISFTDTRRLAATIEADVRVSVPANLHATGRLDVVAAIIERDLVSDVKRGENRGRTLAHAAVCRRMVTVGRFDATQSTFSATVSMPVDAGWNDAKLDVVAFVQHEATRRIVGGATTSIPTRPNPG